MKSLRSYLPLARNTDKPEKGALTPMADFRNEVDRMFERFMSDPFGGGRFESLLPWTGDFSPGRFAPSVDVADEAKHIRVTIELPGIDQKDVELSVREDALYVRGEKKLEEKEEKGDYYRIERAHGRFERIVPLPCEVDATHAEATFAKGVLNVRLPKKEEGTPKTKSIPIKTG